MEYLARPNQQLIEHLETVAKKCSEYCHDIGFGNTGYVIGLLHDFGKYLYEWQVYLTKSINGENHGTVNHSIYGASAILYILNKSTIDSGFALELVNCIYSHHGTLHDMKVEKTDSNTTRNILITERVGDSIWKRCLNDESKDLIDRCEVLVPELELEFRRFVEKETENGCFSSFDMYNAIRFVFSSLVDADRSDAGGLYDNEDDRS